MRLKKLAAPRGDRCPYVLTPKRRRRTLSSMAKKSVHRKSKVPTPPRASNGGKGNSGTQNGEHVKPEHSDSSPGKSSKKSGKSCLSTFMSIAVGVAGVGVVLTFTLSSDEGSCPYGYSGDSDSSTGYAPLYYDVLLCFGFGRFYVPEESTSHRNFRKTVHLREGQAAHYLLVKGV